MPYLLFLLSSLIFSNAFAQSTVEEIRFRVDRYEIVGDNPLGDSRALSVVSPFVGDQFGLDGLSAAADALERELVVSGYNFHRVSLPPQELNDGVVQLRISQFAVGQVLVEGNRFFNDENVLNTVPELTSGDAPNMRELSRSLEIANSHASKATTLRFREGEESDTIDAVLSVEDRDPQVFFLTLDNTGPKDDNEYRTTLGYQHGNLLNRDHQLTATLTTAPEDTESSTQYGLSYRIPLYGHGGNVDFLFSDSDSFSQPFEGIEATGAGTVFGVIYSRPFLSSGDFKHRWSIGYQQKTFDNTVDPGFSEYEVVSAPVELGYSFTYLTPSSQLSGGFTFLNEVGDDDTDYEQDRLEAESGWSAFRYNLSYDYLLGSEWLAHISFSGQSTDALLISGEQFAVGGSTTLRGFEERSVTGDSGYESSLELWLPPFEAYDLRFFVFYDVAALEYNEGDTVEAIDYELSSAGLGARGSWGDNLSYGLDYGSIGEGGGPDGTINQDGDNRFHFNLVYRF